MNQDLQELESIDRCLICREPAADGLMVCSVFICSVCELEIIASEVDDLEYDYYLHQLRRLLFPRPV